MVVGEVNGEEDLQNKVVVLAISSISISTASPICSIRIYGSFSIQLFNNKGFISTDLENIETFPRTCLTASRTC